MACIWFFPFVGFKISQPVPAFSLHDYGDFSRILNSLTRRTICGITLAIKIEGFPVGND